MYLRLSRDDEDKDGLIKSESNSIGSQRELIRSFLREQPDIELYDIYVDDGFSGSNFDRPEFKRMMADIEAGRVNCVIVKEECVKIELNQKALENRDFVMWFCFFDPKTDDDKIDAWVAQGGQYTQNRYS